MSGKASSKPALNGPLNQTLLRQSATEGRRRPLYAKPLRRDTTEDEMECGMGPTGVALRIAGQPPASPGDMGYTENPDDQP